MARDLRGGGISLAGSQGPERVSAASARIPLSKRADRNSRVVAGSNPTRPTPASGLRVAGRSRARKSVWRWASRSEETQPSQHLRRCFRLRATFSDLPWYADHPTNKSIRQETYFLKVVVPGIEKSYPVLPKAEARLLLGFSKSGWGAWNLLLRHPGTFGRAAAWDAPLMMDKLGLYGTTGILGTQEKFESHRIPVLLKTAKLGDKPRLILTGFGSFRQHHEGVHQLLLERKIPHAYRDGPQRKHDWHSGWVKEAVELLLQEPTASGQE